MPTTLASRRPTLNKELSERGWQLLRGVVDGTMVQKKNQEEDVSTKLASRPVPTKLASRPTLHKELSVYSQILRDAVHGKKVQNQEEEEEPTALASRPVPTRRPTQRKELSNHAWQLLRGVVDDDFGSLKESKDRRVITKGRKRVTYLKGSKDIRAGLPKPHRDGHWMGHKHVRSKHGLSKGPKDIPSTESKCPEDTPETSHESRASRREVLQPTTTLTLIQTATLTAGANPERAPQL